MPFDIAEWIARGKPTFEGRPSSLRPTCHCDSIKEQTYPLAVQNEWLSVCSGCRAQLEKTRGLPYDPVAGGFISPSTPRTVAETMFPTAKPIMPRPEVYEGQPVRPAPTPDIYLQPVVPQLPDPTGVGPQIHPTETTMNGSTSLRRTAGLPLQPVSPFSLGGAIVGGITGAITGGPMGAITGGLLGGFKDDAPGTGGRDAGLTGRFAAGCPTGFRLNPQTGQCEREGIVGAFERFIPGGATGTLPPTNGQGMFGALSRAPDVIQTVRRRCPRGMVLGKDDMCYVKGGEVGITNKQRKWPKPPAPMMSAQDAKTLRRAETLKNKAKRVAQQAGYSCRKR